ncbi:MAG: RNA polymerase sigma factor [Gemmatimonadales bacterium]|nr:RNA polymerase sigma factor [Gemmatimonadales bacterium]
MSMDSIPNEDRRRDDLQLARTAAGGDSAAWREIYDQTCQPLFNFLCYQTGDRDTARDLMQETYVTVLNRLDSFQGRGTLLSWMRAVALRKCLDWRRRVSLRMRKLAAFAREQAPLAETTAQGTFPGLSDEFQAALDRLSPRQRAALLLRELEDLPFSEIAENLGCGEPTARVHHHRACRNLRMWLQEGPDLIFDTDAGGIPS